MRLALPWGRLTRNGIPQMVVIRRPLKIDLERTLAVGEVYPDPGNDKRKIQRCRQYFDARRIGPAPEISPAGPAQEKGQKKNGRSKK